MSYGRRLGKVVLDVARIAFGRRHLGWPWQCTSRVVDGGFARIEYHGRGTGAEESQLQLLCSGKSLLVGVIKHSSCVRRRARFGGRRALFIWAQTHFRDLSRSDGVGVRVGRIEAVVSISEGQRGSRVSYRTEERGGHVRIFVFRREYLVSMKAGDDLFQIRF